MSGRSYNATVYTIVDGERSSVFVAEVDEAGKMLRSNWIQFTRYDGCDLYDLYIRTLYPNKVFEIVMDNCQGYKDRIRALALPPAYRV